LVSNSKNISSLPGKLQSPGVFKDWGQNYKVGKKYIIFKKSLNIKKNLKYGHFHYLQCPKNALWVFCVSIGF